jgi:hypothetical protein
MDGINHNAIADIARHTIAHDAGGDELQGRLDAFDHQGVASVVTTLETNDAMGMVG